MPKLEINIKLTPEELYKMLPPKLKELYDDLVNNMLEISGHDKKEIEFIIADLLMRELFKKEEGKVEGEILEISDKAQD